MLTAPISKALINRPTVSEKREPDSGRTLIVGTLGMSEVEPDSPYPESPRARKQRGCLFYGCLIAAILALITIIAVAIGMFFIYRFTTRIVEQYTDTAPTALPRPNLDEAQVQALK